VRNKQNFLSRAPVEHDFGSGFENMKGAKKSHT